MTYFLRDIIDTGKLCESGHSLFDYGSSSVGDVISLLMLRHDVPACAFFLIVRALFNIIELTERFIRVF